MIDDKLTPEKVAEDLLRNFYKKEEFFFDDLCQKDAQISELYQGLKIWEKYREEAKFSNPVYTAILVTEVCNFLYKKALIDKDETLLAAAIHFLRLFNLTYKSMHGKDIQSYLIADGLAVLMVGLKIYGSSYNQAKISLAEWASLSEGTIEKAHTNLLHKKDLESARKTFSYAYFSLNEIKLGRVFLEFKDRNFPCHYSKSGTAERTYSAFEMLREDFKNHLITYKKAPSLNIELLSMDYPDAEYQEIRESFLAHF